MIIASHDEHVVTWISCFRTSHQTVQTQIQNQQTQIDDLETQLEASEYESPPERAIPKNIEQQLNSMKKFSLPSFFKRSLSVFISSGISPIASSSLAWISASGKTSDSAGDYLGVS